MTQPEVLWLNNPFDLTDITRYSIDSGQTIQQWLDDHGGINRLNKLPTVCVVEGRELMRAEYDQLIESPVCFVTLPTGGDSGTNPLAAIAMIALTVYTGGLAAAGYGSLAIGGSFTAGMISAGIMVGGAMLINAVFPPPGLPNTASPTQGSPTYSLGAQGNAARLGSPIPVNYGRMRIYPDFAAQPYTEFESNEQYLYQLFCIGQGENQVTEIRLVNTPIENFEEATVELVPPLGRVTLFHTAVVLAPEAGGQDLSEPITLGPYVLNDVGTECSRVACDVVFPGGLIGVDEDDGDEYSVGVELRIWVDPIDDAGDVSGDSIIVFDESIVDRTRTAIRRTLGKDVPAGRYQMTIQRTTALAPNNEVKSCQLGAMKGYLVDDNEYGDVTLLAMRVRATANLSDAASRLVNVLNERLIPVWNPDSGWSDNVITRNPAWAFADAVRSRYGGDFSDAEIDLNGLHYLAGLFDDRGDTFDGRFDTEQSLWDALGKIGQVCRSGPVRQGNLMRLIRDQLIETPSQLFGMANMSEFSIDYVMHDDRTADSVKITYWDEARDYAETTVLAQLPDDTADNPQEITLFGCTQYEQAWREGMYLAASNRERRQLVSWKTGMEGHIPTFGDLVWINHDLLSADQQFGGTVAAVAGDALTLSRDVALSDEAIWYILIRDRFGQPSNPIPIEQIDSHRVRVLDTLPEIETDPQKEPSHFVIGKGAAYAFPVKVTAITPEDIDKVSIAGCIESEFVHTADEGEIPPPPPDVTPPPPGLDIEDLRSTQGGTAQNPVIYLSWAFAPGADRYVIDYSEDGRQTWQPAGTGQSLINSHEFTCSPGLITCRVAAIAAVRGDWAEIQVNAGGEFDTPGQVVPTLAEPFEGEAMKVQWVKEPAAARYLVEVWSQNTYRRGVYLDRTATTYDYYYTDAQQDSAGRTLTVRVRAQNAEGINGDWGEVTATNPPPEVPTNVEAAGILNSILVRCDYNPDPDILELRVYGEQRSDFTPSPGNLLAAEKASLLSVPVETHSTWYLRLAWVDLWGATGLNYSGQVQSEVGPITETEIGPDSISTPMLKANSVVAGKIAADAITGREISASTTITAGDTAGMNGAEHDDNPDMNDIRFWAGASENQVATAPYRVSKEGLVNASNAEVSGRVMASQISGSSITGTDIQGNTVSGGEINGTNIRGSVIVGSTIILSESLYACDPYGDGRLVYYDDYPDIPLACLPKVEDTTVMAVGTNPAERTYLFNLASAARSNGTIRTSRARYTEIPDNTLTFSYQWKKSADYNDRNLTLTVERFDPDTGEVYDSDSHINIVGNWPGDYTLAGLELKCIWDHLNGLYFESQSQNYGSVSDVTGNGYFRITISKRTAVSPSGDEYHFGLILDNEVAP